MPPPGDQPKGRPPRITLTAAQEAKLRTLWPDRTVRASGIMAAINAEDGPRVTNDGTLYAITHRLGLRVRSELWAEQDAAAPAPAAPEPDAPAVPTAEAEAGTLVPAAAPEPAPPDISTTRAPIGNAQFRGAVLPVIPNEKAEVFDAFAAGQTVRDAAADFGIPMSTLSNWHAEWKLAQRQKESAA